MVDSPARFETSDNQGDTVQRSATVDTTGELVPTSAGAPISEFLVNVPEDQDVDFRILVSIDDVNFMTVRPSGHFGWTPKGQTVTQIRVKSNSNAGVNYEIILNREPD